MSDAATMTLADFLRARLAEDRGVQNVLAELSFTFDPEGLQERTQRRLAEHYADHPDYRDEWAPAAVRGDPPEATRD